MNESLKKSDEEKEIIINPQPALDQNKSTKKIKKKKKGKKKKPEKECKNLKELLEEIKQEKAQKLLKEKKLKERKEEKEEKKEENPIKENLNFINISTSCATTGASSLDDFNLPPNYLLINNNDISENELIDEKINKKRKMSSPIFNYYNGYDKILSSDKEGSIDLANSANFIEKNRFISSLELNANNPININPTINESNEKKYSGNKFNPNEIINIEGIDYNNNMYIKDSEDYMNYYNYNYIPDSKFTLTEGNNDIQNIIKNINNNFVWNFSNMYIYDKKNKNNNKNYEKKNKNKIMNKSNNTIRLGDWTCIYCYNLNFSFRKSCNRCNAPKPIL
jgi:hypothetical protein